MAHIYEEEFHILQYECDPYDRMLPGSVLRRVQEISTRHCVSLGLTEDVYQKVGAIFLLSRVSVLAHRLPGPGEMVRIQTCAFAPQRAVYARYTYLYDQAGELLCEVDSRWVLVDTASRRILRKEPEGFGHPFTELPPPGHDMGLARPDETAHLAACTAAYSLCDKNGHINNTRYADLVCDLLPLEKLAAGPPRRLLLFYRAEIALGQAFDMLGSRTENAFYFVAQQDGHRSFEALAEF